ncbi:MAG TPA: DUF1127 domain-containing protein [Stellaceae bacterium]|nr:DUF1127 domain-containing protein [Stellaceae bacterium]
MTDYHLSPVTEQPRIERRSAFLGLVELFSLWRRRIRERQELARLGERDLHDLGLSRSDVYGEIGKPFWRA